MNKSHISTLSADEQRKLFDNLNYLNMEEIRAFCKLHAIPFRITLKTQEGKTILTKEMDRKGVLLKRIRHFLRTGSIPAPTCFSAAVVSLKPLPKKLTEDDRLFYGRYDKANYAMESLLKTLTSGQFKDGAIARMLARDFWSRGEAPTFAEFAAAWLESKQQRRMPNPEWAYLSDRAHARNISDWKATRNKIASKVLKDLSRLVVAR